MDEIKRLCFELMDKGIRPSLALLGRNHIKRISEETLTKPVLSIKLGVAYGPAITMETSWVKMRVIEMPDPEWIEGYGCNLMNESEKTGVYRDMWKNPFEA